MNIQPRLAWSKAIGLPSGEIVRPLHVEIVILNTNQESVVILCATPRVVGSDESSAESDRLKAHPSTGFHRASECSSEMQISRQIISNPVRIAVESGDILVRPNHRLAIV